MNKLQIVRILIEYNLRVDSIKRLLDIVNKYTTSETMEFKQLSIYFYDEEEVIGFLRISNKRCSFLLYGEDAEIDELINEIIPPKWMPYTNKEDIILKAKIIFAVLINFRS